MFFRNSTKTTDIQQWALQQIALVAPVAKNGIDVEIKPHKTQRTNQQNRFLMAILVALVKFHNETGFVPKGLSDWAMRTDVLKVYYKSRFGIGSTKKLDTGAFGRFIDSIQQSLVEETNGEWEILQPDSAYIQSLLAEGGY